MSDTVLQVVKADCPMRSRIVLNVVGYAFFGLGILGMFLPVMPTTVFWILGAICFARSNPALYRRIVGHKRFGKPVRDMVEQGIISRRSKIIALFGMTVGGVVLVITSDSMSVIALGLGLLFLGALFVATRPERAGGDARSVAGEPS